MKITLSKNIKLSRPLLSFTDINLSVALCQNTVLCFNLMHTLTKSSLEWFSVNVWIYVMPDNSSYQERWCRTMQQPHRDQQWAHQCGIGWFKLSLNYHHRWRNMVFPLWPQSKLQEISIRQWLLLSKATKLTQDHSQGQVMQGIRLREPIPEAQLWKTLRWNVKQLKNSVSSTLSAFQP
jgi:hypothetical protein